MHVRASLSVLFCAASLSACSSDPVPVVTDVPATDVPAADVPAADAPIDAVSPQDVVADRPATDTPAADVPATDATPSDVPATDVPATDATATDAAATDAPATDATATDATATDATATDATATDAGAETLYVATLSAAQEVPANRSTATGTAEVYLNAAHTSVRYVIHHTVAGANAAHIHLGMAGTNGPVAITLSGFGADITGVAAVTAEQVTALDEDRWYVNVHSATNAGGEVRGQVIHTGEALYVAALTGDQEVPVNASTATGTGTVIVNAARTSLRYRVQNTLTPTAAHVHTGAGGSSGGVTFALSTLGTTMVGTQAITPTGLADLERGRWYFNLHTAAFGGGEVRGQILRPGEVLLTTQLSASNEVPTVTSTGAGSAAAILSADRTRLLVDGAFTGLTAASVTAAHLHTGAAGTNGAVAFPLTLDGSNLTGTLVTSAGATTFVDSLLAGGIYVNVHTTANPGGELRGQLTRRPATP